MNVYQWLCVLGIPSIIAGLFSFIALQVKQNKAMRLAVQAILRDRLLQAYTFYSHQGWATYDDKANIQNIYKQYEVLGENGIMDRKHQHFLELPDEPDDEEGGEDE